MDSSGKIIGTRSSRGNLNGLIRALLSLNDFHDLSKKQRKTSIYNLHTLKALIFAGTNFRDNLFSREFLFMILTKIAKSMKCECA